MNGLRFSGTTCFKPFATLDERLPLTPDFAEWLLATTPEENRFGRVFSIPMTADAAGPVISSIGERPKVVVDKSAGQFSPAHDPRRSFGTRWAARVKPATLQRLMRHRDIKTTMDFYVAQDDDDIAAKLWREHDSTAMVSATVVAGSAQSAVGMREPATRLHRGKR